MEDTIGLPTESKNTPTRYNYVAEATTNVPETSTPTKQESFIERIKNKIGSTYNNVKTNAKKQLTFANGKRVIVNTSKNVAKNVANNFGEDVGYLGHQAISSVRNVGLTEKQSIAKYGETQYPSLFGGTGGYADIITSDKGSRSKIKQVTGFSNMFNDNEISYSKIKEAERKRKREETGKNNISINDIDILAKKINTINRKKEAAKKKRQVEINRNKKHKKSLQTIGMVGSPFENIGMIESPFENNKSKPLRRTKSKKKGNIFDEINGMFK
jgi:hypothetical protein